MEKWLDLHMHSSYSTDGEIAPSALMSACAAAGLKTVALTDHNSVRGVYQAKASGKGLGLEVISGIEIDCKYEGCELHLLGYGIDEHADIFADIEKDVHEQELCMSAELMERVLSLGIFFDKNVVGKLAVQGVINAEMIAEAALADIRNAQNKLLAPFRFGGDRSDNPFVNFYWDFCSQGKPAYVPMEYISLNAAIRAIKENNGAAILAHPGINIGQNQSFAQSIVEQGIDGIEAYSNYHDEKTTNFYEQFCLKNNILATTGSDFHGKAKPSIHLGEIGNPMPTKTRDALLSIIKDRGENNY
jgi:3',5'-nucleoside bisphosphate phosphatase